MLKRILMVVALVVSYKKRKRQSLGSVVADYM